MKSLLIGINYIGQQGELRGCHNDVEMMKEYIATQVGSVFDDDLKKGDEKWPKDETERGKRETQEKRRKGKQEMAFVLTFP